MNTLSIVAAVVAIVACIAAVSMVLPTWWREKRRAQREDAVASAAQEYLARFEIRARIVAVTLADQRIALMVETPPHKKLRFSYIIEQPIKHFVLKQTQVEIDRIFWRFPLPPNRNQAPEVQYGGTTTQAKLAAVTQAPAKQTSAVLDEEDDYFQSQDYQIEEVSWENFSNVSKTDAQAKEKKP